MPYELINYPVVCSCLVKQFFTSIAEPKKYFGTFNWSKTSNLALRTAAIMDIHIGRASGWLMLW